MNKAILVGRLTRDPELRTTANGVSVCSFSIAVNRRFKNAEGNYDADFINCVAWRQQAEFLAKYFAKGRMVGLVGSIQTRNWTDQQGQKRYATEVVVDDAMFVDSRGEGPDTGISYTTDAYGSAPSYSSNASAAPNFEEHNTDDDLPF